MNRRAQGFTLVESLIALLLLSVGLLGAGVHAARWPCERTRTRCATCAATNLVRDMADRIRANPHARACSMTRVARPSPGDACEPRRCPAIPRSAPSFGPCALHRHRARACFPATDTDARIEFEPAIGPAAPDRYRISLRWRGPRDPDAVQQRRHAHLLARPVAG